MSRIEEALEKAARKRGVSTAPLQPPRAERSTAASPDVLKRSPAATLRHDNQMLVMLNDLSSPVVEEYRKLKGIVVALTKGDEFHNTLVVTSAIPNEGKSLTALNLAICLAHEMDHTVLLLDADLRRPSVHRYLGVENGPGLAECLQDGVDLAEVIMPTGVEKLSIVRAGGEVKTPVELFSSQRMKDFLAEIKHRYPDRYVIFDSPPVLPFAESRSLAHLVDGVLLVVKEGYTPLANLQEAVASLAGSEILGVIYNDAEIQPFDERYQYYRRYYTYDRKSPAAT